MMLFEILQKKEGFSHTEELIADYILANPESFKNKSARDIGKELFVNSSTLTRMCQKLGFDGFSDFRNAYFDEKKYLDSNFKQIDPNIPFVKNDSCYQIANKIGTLYEEIIKDCELLIDYKMLEEVVNLIDKSRVIYVVSQGLHINLARIFLEKMSWIGKTVSITSHSDVSYHNASNAKQDEIFILVSYSGETNGVVKIAKKLKQLNMPFVAITSFGTNSLSHLSDYVLYISTREKITSGIGNYSSYISVQYLFDVIYSCIFKKKYDENLDKKQRNSKDFQDRRFTNNPILKDD